MHSDIVLLPVSKAVKRLHPEIHPVIPSISIYHYIPDEGDDTNEEDIAILLPIKEETILCFYEIDGATTITTKRRRIYKNASITLSDDHFGEINMRVHGRHYKRRIPLCRGRK